ncbi:MAG: hypothetical protein WCI88_16405 [Chloroflexota bacterium]
MDKVQVLVLGNSHPWMGINPELFDYPGFNLANLGQDLYYDEGLFFKYVDRMPNLRLVMMGISHHTLEFKFENRKGTNWLSCLYLREFGIFPQDPFYISKFDYCVLAMMGGNNPFNNILSWQENVNIYGSNNVVNAFGWATLKNRPKIIKPEEAKNRVQGLNSMTDQKLLTVNLQRLERIQQKLQQRNIQLVLVTVPVTKYYFDSITPDRYERMQNALREFSKKYDVPYYNYLNDASFDLTDFYNSGHLDVQGSKKFTQILNTQILQQYIR